MRRTVQVQHGSLKDMGQRFIGAWNESAKGSHVNETHLTFLDPRTMHNPAHPGELLQGWLSDLGLGVANTAAHLGIGRVTLSRILNGHAGISADIDLRLSEAFGTNPGYWLGMQAAHDVWQAKAQAKSRPKIKRLPDNVTETLHLVSSPANAAKLASAIAQDKAGKVKPRKLLAVSK
jgi:antitoxin HigA-1